MPKKKRMKAAKKKMILLICLLFAVFLGIIMSVFKDWMQIFDNKHQVVTLSSQYENLQEEATQLKSDVNKLQDPDYVARYAREKYLYTKDGELIIRIPKTTDSSE